MEDYKNVLIFCSGFIKISEFSPFSLGNRRLINDNLILK